MSCPLPTATKTRAACSRRSSRCASNLPHAQRVPTLFHKVSDVDPNSLFCAFHAVNFLSRMNVHMALKRSIASSPF
eukprot:1377359-Prymnesium_polylepis.1